MFIKVMVYATSALLCICAVRSCLAQSTPSIAEPGDPQRWYQQDTTPHDYFLTLKKDAEAALQEAKLACREVDKSSRQACLKEAQAQFVHDMGVAKQKEQQSAAQ